MFMRLFNRSKISALNIKFKDNEILLASFSTELTNALKTGNFMTAYKALDNCCKNIFGDNYKAYIQSVNYKYQYKYIILSEQHKSNAKSEILGKLESALNTVEISNSSDFEKEQKMKNIWALSEKLRNCSDINVKFSNTLQSYDYLHGGKILNEKESFFTFRRLIMIVIILYILYKFKILQKIKNKFYSNNKKRK